MTQAEIDEKRQALREAAEELRDLVQRRDPEPVADVELSTAAGAARLSSLFGDHDDLLVVHNMGSGCRYCTMWADSFSAALPSLQRRTAFVVVNGEAPEQQARFAAERGGAFPMASDADGSFTASLGFMPDGQRQPGVSALHRNADGSIVRTAYDSFGPYDTYLGTWNLLALLPGGPGDFAAIVSEA